MDEKSSFAARTMVSITLADLDNMRKGNERLQARIGELEKQVVEAKMADPNDTIKLLREIISHALPIVQFASGNLEPSTIAGWPHAALAALAASLVKMPDVDVPIQELAQDLKNFAKLAAGYEEYRKERDAKRAVMPAMPSDFGPQTEEAAFAHAARVAAVSEDSPGK